MNPCALWRWIGSVLPGGYSTVIITPSLPGNSVRSFEKSGVTFASFVSSGMDTRHTSIKISFVIVIRKGFLMTITKLILMLVCLVSIPLETKEAKVTPLFSKDLTEFPGKEGVMITVEYPPGSTDPIHRHNAHGFIYVLEGSIVMQARGGKEVTLTPGQTFYEGPSDVHVVGRNASQTKPAKFVVFLVKDKGAPVLVPAN